MPNPPATMEDECLRNKIEEIVKEYNISIIVETGTYLGETTAYFAKLAKMVIGIDNDPTFLKMASRHLTGQNIYNALLCLGESPLVLWLLAGTLPQETLFFLDAHWQSYWPIIDEIRKISPGKGVIVIHDMKVPDRPDLGFDSYSGVDLDYGLVKDALTEWSPTHRIEYNTGSEAGRRGAGFIFPK